MAKLLGILGGLGPMSSAYLYKLITEHTAASQDQDHINIILSSRSETPDRTDYILGHSELSPLPYMTEELKKLEQFGADCIIIACNTAHSYIRELRRAVSVPIPNIIHETVDFLVSSGFKKSAILATEGTVSCGLYQDKCNELGLEFELPTEHSQKMITEMIYDCVKCGKAASRSDFYTLADEFARKGCDSLILGCTELSVLAEQLSLYGDANIPYIADSLEILTCFSIAFYDKDSIGFNPKLRAWGERIRESRRNGTSFSTEVM